MGVFTKWESSKPQNLPVTLPPGATKECPICQRGFWTLMYDLTENREVPVQIPHDPKAHGLGMKGTTLYCRGCHSRIGMCPGEVVWTGRVDETPREPDGLLYVQCRRCRSFHRFEVVVPNTQEEAA
jgi:hypothetical protein